MEFAITKPLFSNIYLAMSDMDEVNRIVADLENIPSCLTPFKALGVVRKVGRELVLVSRLPWAIARLTCIRVYVFANFSKSYSNSMLILRP